MVLAHPALNSNPAIDSNEVRWAVDELAGLIAQVGSDSVAGLVLRQAQQELRSLVRGASASNEAATVVGPLRVRRAA